MRLLKLSTSVEHFIGNYGPFQLDGYFAFSNFRYWGDGHNNCFEACIEACRGARCFIDVGAHIGLVTLPASKMLDGSGSVHAFEPGTVNNNFLRRHVQLNSLDNVFVRNFLVGDQNNFVEFFETDYPNGQNSAIETSRTRTYASVQRQQITLDSYCQVNAIVPDVIKIDVEGSEIAVLMGAVNILKIHKPIIFLSIHPTELKATTGGLLGLISLVDDLGYECFEREGVKANEFKLAEYILIHRGA